MTAETNVPSRLLFDTRVGEIAFDYRKVAFLPKSETLLVADLHFEKGSYLQAKGHAPLPTYDTRDTIDRLRVLIEIYRPKSIISLGDSFHDIAAGQRLSEQDFKEINTLIENVSDFIWILGNHDPDIPAGLMGRQEDHVERDGFLLTHLPVDTGDKGVNICGHLHPKIRLQTSRRKFWQPCFACADNRIILPSFGTFTGGLDVTHMAIKNELRDTPCYFAITSTGLIGVQAPE